MGEAMGAAWRLARRVAAEQRVVHETIVTVHAGRPLLACCIVANPAAGLSDKLLDHVALNASVSASVERLSKVVRGVVRGA